MVAEYHANNIDCLADCNSDNMAEDLDNVPYVGEHSVPPPLFVPRAEVDFVVAVYRTFHLVQVVGVRMNKRNVQEMAMADKVLVDNRVLDKDNTSLADVAGTEDNNWARMLDNAFGVQV